MWIVDLQAWNRPIININIVPGSISPLKPNPLPSFYRGNFCRYTDINHKCFNSQSLFCVLVKPSVIELPRVRVLNENSDTPNRQFPVGTVIALICQGEVGSDPSKV